MKKQNLIKLTALSAAFAAALPMNAAAEISGSLAIANQYLWRGQSLFQGGTVSGSLDYSLSTTGLYGGIWLSSEENRTEYDTYVGWGGETDGGFSYDISYIAYAYSGPYFAPTTTVPDGADFNEAHLGLGMAGVGFDAYIGIGDYGHSGAASDNKDSYYSLSYGAGSISGLVGYYDYDAADADYIHLDLSYALNDQLSFTASKIIDTEEEDIINEDLQLLVAYSFAF